MTRRPSGDDGSILLMSIGLFVVSLLLIWAVIDASVVFLARRDLTAAVDGAALTAAQEADADALYSGGAAADLALDPAGVGHAVQTYLDRMYPAGQWPRQRITAGVDGTGRSVQVRGEREVTLPVFGTVTVTAKATATNHRRVAVTS